MLNVGDEAPDFEVLDHRGQKVALHDLRGRRIVLWFYPKADTPGCTIEGSLFRDLSKDYEAKKTTILGVSFDDPHGNSCFAEKFDFPYQLLCDTDRKIGMAYGAADSPTAEYAKRIAYVIDENGRIAEAHEKVDPRTYPKDQLATL